MIIRGIQFAIFWLLTIGNLISECEIDVGVSVSSELTDAARIITCDKLRTDYALYLEEDASGPQYDRLYHLQSLARDCQDMRFGMCYPNLKPSMQRDQLETYFSSWINDIRFRYPRGIASDYCEKRAEHLAHELATLGYRANIIHINAAPVMIALERTQQGELTGHYWNFNRFHAVVQILVPQNGSLVPYILDPQFMNEPMERSEYFRRTIGQDCSEIESYQNSIHDLYNHRYDIGDIQIRSSIDCYFGKLPQNISHSPINVRAALEEETMFCGWHTDPRENDRLAQDIEQSGDGSSLVGFKINEDLISESLYRDLIVRHYGELHTRIQDLISISEEIIEMKSVRDPSLIFEWEQEEFNFTLAYHEQRLLQLRQDLDALPQKIKEIRGNLGFVE